MKYLIFAVLILSQGYSKAYSDEADLILTNAKLFINGKVAADQDSVAIKDGHIHSLFKGENMASLFPHATQIIDVGQDLVIPGIIDAHVHSVTKMGTVTDVSLNKLNPTKDDVSAAISAAVSSQPKGTWIYMSVGEHIIDDPSVNAKFIDTLSPSHPVWLGAYYGHGDIMNSLAMKELDIEKMPEANAGGIYEKDADGNLTGRLFEYAHWVPKAKFINALTDEEIISLLHKRAAMSLKMGITAWHDMPMLDFSRYVNLLEKAALPIKVTAIPLPHISVPKGSPLPSSKRVSDTITVQGEKWILDGTPIERGAALSVEYADMPGWRGRTNFSSSVVGEILDGVIARKSQPLFHIAGDRTLDILLTEMEKRLFDWKSLRVRVEHGDGINEALLDRVNKLGITIVQNPSHFMNRAIGTERVPQTHPFMMLKTLVESDVSVALGSDGPMNPYLNMMFARIHKVRPQEGVDVATSLQLYTRGAAFAGMQENEIGQIKVGMKADLAVLTQNILTVPIQELAKTESRLTIIDGEVVYQADK